MQYGTVGPVEGASVHSTSPPASMLPIAHKSRLALEVDDAGPSENGEEEWEKNLSSVTSSIRDYEFENGRRYHAYKAGQYPLPNDESELDRLDLQHHVFTLTLSGELHLAPLKDPKKILDIGTGTGLWAIEMADRFPNAVVTGVDLSPVQPNWVPDNVRFEIDDVESNWLYKEDTFDYIHSRIMVVSIGDWDGLFRNAYRHLKPGGWFEVQELDPTLDSDDGTHKDSPNNDLFTQLIFEGSAKYGKPIPRYTEWKEKVKMAGFVDVHEQIFKIPTNTWPKDKQLKEIGKYQLMNYHDGYEGIGIGLYTRALGWTSPEFAVFLAKIRTELKDRKLHTYHRFSVVYGRKPFPQEPESRPIYASPASSAGRSSPPRVGPSIGTPISLPSKTARPPNGPSGTVGGAQQAAMEPLTSSPEPLNSPSSGRSKTKWLGFTMPRSS